MMNVEILT